MSELTFKLEDLITWHYDDPTAKVEEIRIENTESGEDSQRFPFNEIGGAISRRYAYVPYLELNNGYIIPPQFIKSFHFDMYGFSPKIDVTFADGSNSFASKYYPKDGAIVKLYIASIGDEKTYSPIRMDFRVTSVSDTGSPYKKLYTNPFMHHPPTTFRLDAEINIPALGYRDNQYNVGTSWEALRLVARSLGLGFDSNVEATSDGQVWLNAHTTTEDYIKRIAAHAYSDKESFYTVYINPFYALTFVELNRLFYMGGENDKCIVYTSSHRETYDTEAQDARDAKDLEEGKKDDEWVGNQHETEYCLTNSRYASGWSHYISDYEIIDSPVTTYQGYKQKISLWDKESSKLIEDEVIPYCYETEGLMPLNKGRLIDGEPDEASSNLCDISYEGWQSDFVHPSYIYSERNHDFNMSDMRQFGMRVELNCVNPAITRYSRIKLFIYEKDEINAEGLKETPGTESGAQVDVGGTTSTPDEHPELMSDTTPRYDTTTDEGLREAKDSGIYPTGHIPNKPDNEVAEILNESLSGYYVVAGYSIYMSDKTGGLRQRVTLYRREHKPPLKSDYQ